MTKSKLIEILKTFSKEELKEFEKFTASPYFARGRNLMPLLKVLKSFYPEFDHKNFTNEYIFTKLFPGKKFNDSTSKNILKTLSFELIQMCRSFLINYDFGRDENSKNFHLLNKLREKKLYKEYEKFYKNAVEFQEKNDGGSVLDFLDKYFLTYTYNEYCVEARNYKGAFEAIAALDEIAAVIGLIRGYRGFEFKYLASIYNVESVNNFSEILIQNLDSEKMLEEIKSMNSKYYPFIKLNFMFYMIGENPESDDYYFEFKKTAFENLNLFGHAEKYILFSRLSSYCAQVSPERYEATFRKEEFEIYKKTLEIGVHKGSEKDDLSIHHYKNILNSALSLNELQWAEDFAEKYCKEVSPDDIENMKNYSYAFINYEKKEYEKSLENIQNVKFNFAHYKIDIKNLMFKIYYDMNLPQQAFSILETTRQYLSSTEDLYDELKKRNLNFNKSARELLKLKESAGKAELNFFENKVAKENLLSSKKWLLYKIDELKKSLKNKNVGLYI